MGKVTIREEVKTDPRRAMTPARKRRIHTARGGKCSGCGKDVPVSGPGVTYDHTGTLWITGSDGDDDINLLCDDCDDEKTPKDLSRIAKTKRQRSKHIGDTKPKKPIPSRGFNKTLRRRFNGRVEPRR